MLALDLLFVKLDHLHKLLNGKLSSLNGYLDLNNALSKQHGLHHLLNKLKLHLQKYHLIIHHLIIFDNLILFLNEVLHHMRSINDLCFLLQHIPLMSHHLTMKWLHLHLTVHHQLLVQILIHYFQD
ncbi:MAG: Uncharacterised protein [Methanobacteriota archaeon]|nr:MAG: Uncharacterised protein [Euryarchaeota archaeon]